MTDAVASASGPPDAPAGEPAGLRAASGERRPRLLFLVTEDWYFWSHRLPMARAARDAGFDVVVATRCADHGDRIRGEGFELHPLAWDRRSLDPLATAREVLAIRRLYRRVRPDIVHHVALKPVVIGGLAAAAAGVPRVVNAITGLGSSFLSTGLAAAAVRAGLRIALGVLLGRKGSVVVVQNQDDAAALTAARLIDAGRIHVIRGSGVDLERFAVLPSPAGPVTFGFVGRMLVDKGVPTLLDAFERLRARGVDARLVLAGAVDAANASAIPEVTLRQRVDALGVRWLGQVEDIREVWAQCHVAVLPSRREGLPLSLLEAAACGRPLIATDVPGCREVAVAGDNALLVPPDDVAALAAAMERMAAGPGLRAAMGARSRALVDSDLSAAAVGRTMVAVYEGLLGGAAR